VAAVQYTFIHTNSTQNDANHNRTTQIRTNLEECGLCHVFASFTLAFALQLRKKHGQNLSQGRRRVLVYILPEYPHVTKPTHTHIHTLQNPPTHTWA